MKIDYEVEVLKKYPDAVAKHWSYDNGHGVSSFWAISKQMVNTSYDPDNYISNRAKTQKLAWKSAYESLTLKTTNDGK